MSLLDGFQICGGTKEKPFLTLRSHTITFSKSTIELLGYPEYVHVYIDTQNCKYAIQPCQADALAMRFFTAPEPGKQVLVRWANKERVSDLTQLLDLSQYEKGARIYGTFHQEENVIIYDINTATGVQ